MEYEDLKEMVRDGRLPYEDIGDFEKQGVINRDQATYLRKLWNSLWREKGLPALPGEERVYEKLFSPTKLRIEGKEGEPERIILSDDAGHEIVLTSNLAIDRIHGLLYRKLGMTYAELRHAERSKKEELMTKALRARTRPLKVIFDEKGEPVSIATPIHQRFNWTEVRKIIESCVKEVYGEVESDVLGNSYVYRLPVKNKYVSAWLNVDPGNNLCQGRSAIKMNTRFRTEYDTASRGIAAPCMNWCNLWTVPTQLFEVKELRLRSLYDIIGAETVKSLQVREIHVKGGVTIDIEEFKKSLQGFTKALEKIQVVFNDAVKASLSREEMNAILDAYDEKVGVPKYVRKMIMDNVKEETIWGFSQAISWVRTHGKLRGKGDRERRSLTQKLGNMAAEVLSLTPAIIDLKQKVGEITTDILLGKTVPVVQ